MNFQPAGYQPPNPFISTITTNSAAATIAPLTTTTNTTTTTTTTTTTSTTTTNAHTLPAGTSRPIVNARPVGWHAKTLGFDWKRRSEQHHYRQSTGLPGVHAAVINNDWDTASELLCKEDIGMLWLPTTSQQNSAKNGNDTEYGTWASTLPSKN